MAPTCPHCHLLPLHHVTLSFVSLIFTDIHLQSSSASTSFPQACIQRLLLYILPLKPPNTYPSTWSVSVLADPLQERVSQLLQRARHITDSDAHQVPWPMCPRISLLRSSTLKTSSLFPRRPLTRLSQSSSRSSRRVLPRRAPQSSVFVYQYLNIRVADIS